MKSLFIHALKGTILIGAVCVAIFMFTRGSLPHTSELGFIGYSDTGEIFGSVVPASCEATGYDHTGYGCWTFYASPATINYGQSSNLYHTIAVPTYWSQCYIGGTLIWSYPSYYQGNPLSTGPLYTTTAYTHYCTYYGALTEYFNATVTVNPPATCPLPWGGTLAHAASVTAYQASTVNAPSSCVSESRTCTNGSLSGSYTNSSCSVLAQCPLPWGGNLTNGSSVTAYQNSSVVSPASCVSESRSCSNGTLAGSYTNQACTVVTNGSCSTPLNVCTYGNLSDSTDSSSQYLWSCTGINGGTTADCSLNKPVSIAQDIAQVFSYGQATAAISPITITDSTSPVITAANDIRIKIATSTVNMLWDTTDTAASISGSASGKVSTTVSYEGGGSVLVIPVNSDFSASQSITISGLSFTNFSGINTATSALRLYLGGASDTSIDDNGSVGTITLKGALTVANHSAGQVTDVFNQTNEVGETIFAFRLTPGGENVSVTSLTFNIEEVSGISTGNVTNVALYRDTNSNKAYDGGDVAVGGSGTPSINGNTGTITFSSSFSATAASDYILVADVASISSNDTLRISLPTTNIVTSGVTTALAITGSGVPASVQHRRNASGGGGSSSAVAASIPTGDGIQSGGSGGSGGGGFIDSDTGDSLGNEPGFNPPSSTSGSWTSGSNAYVSDGSYATAASSVTQTYGNFGFSVPSGNTINGIEVKFEASASTGAGTISVRLSWDGGTTDTSLLTTATLTTLDGVYSIGGPTNTWGHTWSASEFNNGNFVIEVVGNPSGNTVRIDAIQARVYHQASGGGGGGGGAVFKESDQYFATVYTAFKDTWKGLLQTIFGWIVR